MFNLSKPLHICRAPIKSRYPWHVWVCEWQWQCTGSLAILASGLFLVEARHPIEATHTAKKFLRDELLESLDFTFEIRALGLLERLQLRFMPKLLFSQDREATAARDPAPKLFADTMSADSKSKT